MKVILLLLAFATVGNAQVRGPEFTDRMSSPGPQIASGQDAWSLFNNPAGLAFVAGSELVGGYSHHWSNPAGVHNMALSAAFGLFGGLSVGVGLGLSLPDSTTPLNQGLVNGQFGLAYRFGRAFSMGAWAFKQRRYALDTADPFLLGFGVQYYPLKALALGALARQVYSDFGSPLELQTGVSVRPFGDQFTVFSDLRLFPSGDKWSLGYQIDPIAGFQIDLGGTSIIAHAIIRNNPLFIFGLNFNYGHYGQGVIGGNDYIGARFKLSSEGVSSSTPASKQWVSVEINSQGTLNQDFSSLSARLFSKPVSPLFFLDSLDKLAQDPSIKGLVVHLEPLALGFARAEELRSNLLEIKSSGKQVIVYLNNASAIDYYVASAANKVYLNPAADLRLDNFRSTLIHIHQGLENLGIEAEAITAGKYKSFPKLFTADKPNPQELEVSNAILDERYAHFIDALAQKSGKSIEQVKAQINLGELTASEAMTFGLVDGVISADNIPSIPKQFRAYFTERHRIGTWGELDHIAIIPIVGTIIEGRAKPSFFFPQSQTGSADVIDLIEQAAKSPHVKGILLRIDSPGGDAIGSDLIYQALLKAREQKPIVASMGDVAASGGYFAAAAANQIWAEPSTLTGSIGVFSLHFSAQKLLGKLGVSSFEIKRGQLPGPTLFRPLTPAELKRGQQLIDWRYARFKQAVADGQNLPLDHVAEIAEGRVWTGEQALKNKLVHNLGGFSQALANLRTLAGIKSNAPIQLALYQKQDWDFLGLKAGPFANLEDLVEHQGRALTLMPFIL